MQNKNKTFPESESYVMEYTHTVITYTIIYYKIHIFNFKVYVS